MKQIKALEKVKFLIISLILMAGFCVPHFSVNANRRNEALPRSYDYKHKHISHEILVKFKNDHKIRKIKFNQEKSIEHAISEYQRNSEVEFAQPNYIYETSLIIGVNDPDINKQKYLEQIQIQDAWNRTTGSRDVIVAVIDTGVQNDHPDLKRNIWFNPWEVPGDNIDNDGNGYIDDQYGWDFIKNNGDSNPKFEGDYEYNIINHGTVVAGIIAGHGNNGQGIAGISWNSRIMSLRALDSEGYGTTFNVAKAIDYAKEMKADVINMSFVGANSDSVFENAIKRATDSGIIIVAAAGNEEGGAGINMNIYPKYPVCEDFKILNIDGQTTNRIIGVVAVDINDQKTYFSNFGSHCVDISAPGENIFSTVVYSPEHKGFEKYYGGGFSGTSVAAPMVTGAIALIKSVRPDLPSDQIKEIIIENTDDINFRNPNFVSEIGGRLNIEKAVEAAVIAKVRQAENIVASTGFGYFPEVKTIDRRGSQISSFMAYSQNFRGGVNLAIGDIDADGQNEIITGTGEGGGPHVRAFSRAGEVKAQFFAFDSKLRYGVKVSVGDINGNGKDEIIASANAGMEPRVKVFDNKGNELASFLAYAPNFLGGVNVAVGDVDGDNQNEIVVGAGNGGGPHIRIFDGHGNLKYQFFAFESSLRGGVNVAVADLNGNGLAEIIANPGNGNEPMIKVLDFSGYMKNLFLAYASSFRGGVNVAVGDVDSDGTLEIITGAGHGGGPHVRMFSRKGELKYQFFAFDQRLRNGTVVASGGF